jgi:hypothetical protein
MLRHLNIDLRYRKRRRVGAAAFTPREHGSPLATFDIYNAGQALFAQEKLKIVGHVPGLIGTLCLDSRMMKRQRLPAATHEHNK